MAANKVSLEKVLQSAFKNKKAGTDLATSILGVEALVVSGIDETAMVANSDAKVVGRCRAGICHKEFGKRLADAMSTIDSIIVAESLSVVAVDEKLVPSTNKQMLRKVSADCFARKDVGEAVSDLVSKVAQSVDQLLVIYGVGGAKADAPTAAALAAIKAILVS